MSEKLSLLDNSSDSEVELTINKNYANRYDQWRNQEELQKYKDLKKDEEDSESSSESDDAEIPEFDEEFFRALSLVKSKDPRIYDENFQLFQNEEMIKKPNKEKQKPVYMKDYERKLVLERGGKFSDEDDEDNLQVPTYDEEQENLKQSFKEALGGSDDSDCDADDLLQVRTKTKKEEEYEEADYVKWLKGEEKEISEDTKKDMSYLRNYWNDPELDESEKFLKDYILNKRYLEKDDSEIPTYEELTSGVLSDDEKMVEEQDKFEYKYNYRFQEPDEEFIKRYPRTVGDSLRRVDNRRKEKREEIAERKRKEMEQRREELKRLKALKRREIEEKFMKLKEISGRDEINFNESDIESDFDPDKHDQKMREMFNDKYYQVEEEKKPEFPFDEELDSENWNAWAGEKIVEEGEEDEHASDKEENDGSNQGESNANPKDDFANEMINASRPKKKVKKKSLFAKIISETKPIYDPDGKSFEEYLDEYYKLDYEDVVGGMPVRYKYRQVIPNDFGLTMDEILAADDRELNRWCSVKKTCQYRNDDEELYDVQAFQKKAEKPLIKKKFLPSVYAANDADDSVTVDEKNSKGEEKYSEAVGNFDNSLQEVDSQGDSVQCSMSENIGQTLDENQDHMQVNGHKKKKKKRKVKLNASFDGNETESLDIIQSNDTDANKSNLESSACDDEDDDNNKQNIVQSNEQLKKSKKKKYKVKQNISVVEMEDLIMQVNELKKKKNKIKLDSSFNGDEIESSDITQRNDTAINKSNLKSSACDDEDDDNKQNAVQSNEQVKKSKKKKRKVKQNIAVMEMECENSNVVNESTNTDLDAYGDESSNLVETSRKSTKRKREHCETSLLVSDSKVDDIGVTSNHTSPKSNQKHVSHSNDTANSSSNIVSESISEEPPKKKKKKKKKKNKRKESDMSNNSMANIQGKKSPFHNKLKNKHKKYASEDKRLGLSAERLAAYGINPKKFKNRIIYSKK